MFSTPHLSPLLDRGGEETLAANDTKHRPSRQKVTRLLPLQYRFQRRHGLMVEPLDFPWLLAIPPMRMLGSIMGRSAKF